jgi:transaldolase
VLAASFRGLREVTDAVLAGSDHMTVPPDLLLAMDDHALSDQAIVELAEAME